jgi:spore maturation protein SpmA
MQVTSIPTTVILDRQGQIASRMNGFLADSFVATLTSRVRALLQ